MRVKRQHGICVSTSEFIGATEKEQTIDVSVNAWIHATTIVANTKTLKTKNTIKFIANHNNRQCLVCLDRKKL